MPIDEAHPVNPNEPYGVSKLAGDRLVSSYTATYDIPGTILRFFNLFGPNQPRHNVIPTIISQAIQKDKVELGNTTPSRDFTYVKDAVNALITVIRNGKKGQAYNVGQGSDIQIGELAQRIVTHVNPDAKVISTSTRSRIDEVEIPRHQADASEIRKLGWEPEISLQAGIEETVATFN